MVSSHRLNQRKSNNICLDGRLAGMSSSDTSGTTCSVVTSDGWVGSAGSCRVAVTVCHPIVIVSGRRVTETSLLMSNDTLIVVADVETESSRVDFAVTQEEQSAEDWLSHDVENTVEDSFRIRGDDVATFAKTPGDWVDKPKEDGPDTAEEEGPVNVRAESISMLACDPCNIPGDEEECNRRKDEITPFVGRRNESTDKTSNNHDFVHENGVQYGRPWEPSSQEQV